MGAGEWRGVEGRGVEGRVEVWRECDLHTLTHASDHTPPTKEFHFRALQTDILEVEVRNSGRLLRQFWGRVKVPLSQFLRWRGTT